MKDKDVKILWGRSGNRCAICKIELTAAGSTSILGEMAHIVAKSTNGPRGESDLTPEERDEYDNLILLCPTHHTLIDSNLEEWTVENLKLKKLQHENWVSNQLSQNNISINSIDNSGFLESREKDWINFAGKKVWAIVSLTPLNIFNDCIDPLKPELVKSINSLQLPQFNGYGMTSDNLNSYHTRPNEYGVINEDLRNLQQYGFGHKIQIFRNGYCEFLTCLEYLRTNPNSLSIKGLFYEKIATSFIAQIKGLINIWNQHLSFNDMLLTTLITQTTNISLYSGEKKTWGGYVSGHPVSSSTLKYSIVINKSDDVKSVQEVVIKRFVNYFGLNINSVFSENGNLNLPSILYP